MKIISQTVREQSRSMTSVYPWDTPADRFCRIIFFNFRFANGIAPKTLAKAYELSRQPGAIMSEHECASADCAHPGTHLACMLDEKYWQVIHDIGCNEGTCFDCETDCTLHHLGDILLKSVEDQGYIEVNK